MKPLREYIKIAFVSFILLLLFVESLNFLFGSKSRTLGNSYGPQSVEEIINDHLINDSIVLAISITIMVVLMFFNDKYKSQKKQQDKKPPLNDPILDKIIEDALNGKNATEDSESEVDDTENAEKEGSDVKN